MVTGLFAGVTASVADMQSAQAAVAMIDAISSLRAAIFWLQGTVRRRGGAGVAFHSWQCAKKHGVVETHRSEGTRAATANSEGLFDFTAAERRAAKLADLWGELALWLLLSGTV